MIWSTLAHGLSLQVFLKVPFFQDLTVPQIMALVPKVSLEDLMSPIASGCLWLPLATFSCHWLPRMAS